MGLSLAQSIPASAFVQVTPGVIGAGGTGLTLSGLALTQNTSVPIGTVASFPTQAAVAAYFGDASPEAAAAAVYFLGFDNSNIKPGALLFAQYPWEAPVNPYLRSGPVSGLSLTQLQAIDGTLSVTINGVVHTGTVNLSAATSFSDAAEIIEAALAPAGDASSTNTSISGTALTIAGSITGTIEVGQIISGIGITGSPTVVSGSGNNWVISSSQSVSGITVTYGAIEVTYSSTLGEFTIQGGTPGAVGTIGFATGSAATPLKLTAATGAVTSQGAAIAVPGTFMDGLIDQFTNFAKFTTIFEPVTDDKVAFAAWTNAQNNRYAYAMSDSDEAPTTNSDTSSAGYLIRQNAYSGTILIFDPNWTWKAFFNMGATASIDFTEADGRITLAYKSQSGLPTDVGSQIIADNLEANGYNFYGSVATAAQPFLFYYPGSITGEFLWDDSYCDQISLNAALQLAMMELLTTVKSIPYNNAGAALIFAAALDPISQAVSFGSIVAGVTLSNAQQAEVNAAAGQNIVNVLFQQGWFLLIGVASAQTRGNRGSPPITLWYCDGESVQKIAMASIDIL